MIKMVTLQTSLKIVRKGGPKVNFIRPLKRAMMNIGERISKFGMEAAKADYMSKRKTKKLPSLIFGSFTYEGTVSIGSASVQSVVFAGGLKASYAIYVDIGHTLRNGVWWEGYNFSKAGAIKSIKEFPRIAKDELNKIKNISII